MKLRDFKGILFDFDGTLARTMEDNLLAWNVVLKEFDFEIAPEEIFLREGMYLPDMAALFFSDRGLPVPDLKSLIRKKDAQYLESNNFALYPGVEELIPKLKTTGHKLGIVSAGTKFRIENTVPEDFLGYFDAIITSENFTRGKPHPDPYLQGAALLSLSPQDCLVIENAPLGVQSAKAAGMICIGITSTLGEEHLQGADLIIPDFAVLSDKFAAQ